MKLLFNRCLIFLAIWQMVFLEGCGTKVQEGQTFIDFTLKDSDGNSVSLSGFRGKIILLHFWADYCSECRAEFPRMEEAYKRLRNRNFELIAVNAGQSKDHVQDFKEEYAITFPMLVDESASVAKLYNVHALPTNFLISPAGVILDIRVGWVSNEYLESVLVKVSRK